MAVEITPALLAALKLVRNMAYEFQDHGNVLYDLVDTDYDEIANRAALDTQSDAIDAVDKYLIDLQTAD